MKGRDGILIDRHSGLIDEEKEKEQQKFESTDKSYCIKRGPKQTIPWDRTLVISLTQDHDGFCR